MTAIQLGQGRLIQLGVGAASTSEDNRVFTRGEGYAFDFVALLDSRAARTPESGDTPFVKYLEEDLLRRGATYLILTRPLNLTVFPTLVALHRRNTLQCRVLLSNVGFVDTTPKKADVLLDLRQQLSDCSLDFICRDLQEYQLSAGAREMLSTCELTPTSIGDIGHTLGLMCDTAVLLTTPQLDGSRDVGRARPQCFFTQLHSCNDLVRAIGTEAQAHIADISDVGIHTFDGVHYRDAEHRAIYEVLSTSLDAVL